MRIVFMGTPDFAVPSLRSLAATPGMEIAAVVCQPDRPAGRGGQLRAPAVKLAALALGLPVWQPSTVKDDASLDRLRALAPDALAVVAFGQILPRRVFDLPRWGAVNAHASLLPLLRGAAPIQWALAQGMTRTGVTTMRINAGLDTGDILLARSLDIAPDETAPRLSPRLASLAAALMVETLHGLAAGAIAPTPQPAGATLAPLLKKEDGRVDWSLPAASIYNRWRGFQPWPGTWTLFHGARLAILQCSLQAGAVQVECGHGLLTLEEVQLEGRKPVTAAEFTRAAGLPAVIPAAMFG